MSHRVALSHSSSADSISDVHGPGTDDTHNVSQWREVLPGEEIPFEFEAREKLRHRYSSDSHCCMIVGALRLANPPVTLITIHATT